MHSGCGYDPDTVRPVVSVFEALAQTFEANGYSTEELKMVYETQKIMGDDSIRVTATTVRVPVTTGHSESVNVETERKLSAVEAREILAKAPGVIVQDDPANDDD